MIFGYSLSGLEKESLSGMLSIQLLALSGFNIPVDWALTQGNDDAQ